MMTEYEIVQSYKHAKNPREQIEILSMLNDCSIQEIRNILINNGCEIAVKKQRIKVEKPKEVIKPEEPPVIEVRTGIKEFLQEQMAEAMEQQELLRRQFEEATKMVNSLQILLSKC